MFMIPATWVFPSSSSPNPTRTQELHWQPAHASVAAWAQNTQPWSQRSRPTQDQPLPLCVLRVSLSSCVFTYNLSSNFTVMCLLGGQTMSHGKACQRSESLELLVGPDVILSFCHLLHRAAGAPACLWPNLHHQPPLPWAHGKSQQPR